MADSIINDRNFDDLIEKFSRKVYTGLKGDIRLAVIRRDLLAILPDLDTSKRLRVLDYRWRFGTDFLVACRHGP